MKPYKIAETWLDLDAIGEISDKPRRALSSDCWEGIYAFTDSSSEKKQYVPISHKENEARKEWDELVQAWKSREKSSAENENLGSKISIILEKLKTADSFDAAYLSRELQKVVRKQD